MATTTKNAAVRKSPAQQRKEYVTHVQTQAAKVALVLHGNFRHLTEADFYPAHDKRKESPEYKKVHDDMVHTQGRPCLVCGVTDAVLKDRTKKNDPAFNPAGAKQLETHHHVIEWALANAIDPAKFNQHIRPSLAKRHANEAMYQRDMSYQEILDWVDHSPDNLWVLCDVHHRSKYVGIHAITYPIWCPQDLLSIDYLAAVKRKIADNNKAARKAKKAAPKKAGKKGKV